MCHEYSMWRRRIEKEAREIWRDFERSAPAAEADRSREAPETPVAEGAEPARVLMADR